MSEPKPLVHEPFDFFAAPPPIDVQALAVLVEIRDLLKAQASPASNPPLAVSTSPAKVPASKKKF